MKTVLLAILILTFVIVIGIFITDYFAKRSFKRFIAQNYKAVNHLTQKLLKSEAISEDEILKLVTQPGLRQAVFQLLTSYGRKELFPSTYDTLEKGSESFLVTWLEFPTELGHAPDEIKLFTNVSISSDEVYYVFQYRSQQPKWAAKLGWMIGVVGPYSSNSSPYDVPDRIFSRFNAVGSITAEEEVKWVHENINQH